MDNQNQPQNNPFFPQQDQNTPPPTPPVNETPQTPAPDSAQAPAPIEPTPAPATPVIEPTPITPVTPPSPFTTPEAPAPAPGPVFGSAPEPAQQASVPTAAVSSSRLKKLILPLSIAGGVIVIAVGGYFGLTAYANVSAQSYAKSVYAAIQSSDLKNDSSKFDDDSVDSISTAESASDTFQKDVTNFQKSLPTLPTVPLGSILSSKYKSAVDLQTKAKKLAADLTTDAAILKDYLGIAKIDSNFETQYDNDGDDYTLIASDLKKDADDLKALKVGSDLKDLQNANATYFQQAATFYSSLATTDDPFSLTEPDTATFEKVSDDTNTNVGKKFDSIDTEGQAVEDLANKLK